YPRSVDGREPAPRADRVTRRSDGVCDPADQPDAADPRRDPAPAGDPAGGPPHARAGVHGSLDGWDLRTRPLSSSPILRRHPRDQPLSALEREIVPQPGERDDKAVAQPDQEIDVRHRPEQPGDEALEVGAAELDHGAAPADRGEVAGMAIAERRQRLPLE